ncbi:MAG: family 10 glycosylhydrolase, partial [Planctomycetota bacterium]
LDITAERLKSKKLLILPHNPGMPDEVARKLLAFLDGGGKLIVFYGLPGQLRPAVGIEGGRHVPETRPGHFASMRFLPDVLQGAPAAVEQHSWNLSEAKAVAGKSRVAAVWQDDAGQPTGDAAIVVSGNCIQMTHVWLADDPANKPRLMLALVGHFLPEFWERAARARIARVGCFGPFKSLAEAQGAVQAGKAVELHGQAEALCKAGKWAEALNAAAAADALLLSAYCAALKPEPGEHRAFWCHSAFGVQGLEWDAAIKLLADNGFTTILPNMLWGGTAFYESSVLPVAPEVREKGDQIAKCLAACKKYGLQCHVWKVNWNMSGRAPKEFVEKMRAAGRTQVHFDGKPENTWLCPSHPDNQKLEIEAMVEVATKYGVDGIHFDYIRYPGPDECFCPGCRERFEAAAGEKVKNWPADVRRDEGLRQKWLDFRRENITKVVAGVHEAARKAKPGIKISAAVFQNWSVDRDGVGQDWKLWCERGYLDFVCPMDYTTENGQFESLVRRQLGWAGKVPCYPGIGLSCWPPPADFCKLVDQIQITRRFKTGGFTIFNYSVAEARDIVPLCGKGITKKP